MDVRWFQTRPSPAKRKSKCPTSLYISNSVTVLKVADTISSNREQSDKVCVMRPQVLNLTCATILISRVGNQRTIIHTFILYSHGILISLPPQLDYLAFPLTPPTLLAASSDGQGAEQMKKTLCQASPSQHDPAL